MSYRDKTHKVIFTGIINSNIPQLIANIDLVSLIFATCHFPITELMNYIWSNFVELQTSCRDYTQNKRDYSRRMLKNTDTDQRSNIPSATFQRQGY